MIGTNDDKEESSEEDTSEEEVLDTESSSEDEMPDIGGDTMINVEELVAKIEATDEDETAHKRDVRKRLEELHEEKEKDLDSTFNFNMDEDL